jgi:hypothetical protein
MPKLSTVFCSATVNGYGRRGGDDVLTRGCHVARSTGANRAQAQPTHTHVVWIDQADCLLFGRWTGYLPFFHDLPAVPATDIEQWQVRLLPGRGVRGLPRVTTGQLVAFSEHVV